MDQPSALQIQDPSSSPTASEWLFCSFLLSFSSFFQKFGTQLSPTQNEFHHSGVFLFFCYVFFIKTFCKFKSNPIRPSDLASAGKSNRTSSPRRTAWPPPSTLKVKRRARVGRKALAVTCCSSVRDQSYFYLVLLFAEANEAVYRPARRPFKQAAEGLRRSNEDGRFFSWRRPKEKGAGVQNRHVRG